MKVMAHSPRVALSSVRFPTATLLGRWTAPSPPRDRLRNLLFPLISPYRSRLPSPLHYKLNTRYSCHSTASSSSICKSCHNITLAGLDSARGQFYHKSWADVETSSHSCPLCWKIRYYVECLRAQYGTTPLRHIVNDPPPDEPQEPIHLRRRRSKHARPTDASYIAIERRGLAHETYLIDEARNAHHLDDLSALHIAGIKNTSSQMPENTKTVYNLSSACQIATEWLQECKQNHPDCAFPYKSNLSPLPARVLDLDSNPPSPTPESIFLRIGKESKGEYAILSHCWGGTTVITTTTANVRTFIDHGIDYETMPQTFRDAIDVCRQLGIRYLWIDSLCIIQDDEKDWEVESAKMADYYAGAMITLAANAAPTGDYGFFKWQSVLESTHISAEPPQSTDASVPQDSERGCIASLSLGRAHPLEYRAWVLQEQTLSRRVLSFNRGEVGWACTEACSNMGPDRSLQGLLTQGPVLHAEPGPHIGVGIRGSGTMVQRYGPNPLNLIVNPGLDPGRLLFSPSGLWYLLITNYSCRRLTFVSDKLPALAGLVKLYQNSREDKFLAGLWQSDIVMGLMWRHLGSDSEKSCGRPKELKSIPTWSWASVGGGVAWLKMYVANRRTDLVMQTPEVTYSGTPLTSPISTATLTFLSRMEKVIIGTEIIGGDGINSRHHLPVWRNDGAGSYDEKPGEAIGTCLLDYNLGNDSREIYAMYLMTHDNLEEGDHSWGPFRTAHDALLLEPTGNDREYRRIGVGWFEGKSEVFHPGKCIYQTIHVV